MAEGSLPVPDPTRQATDAIERAVAAERDYVDGQFEVLKERLRGIDVATKLLNETVNRVPTDVTKEVTHLRELITEKFDSVETQFKERDSRSERESKDNKVAVDAAFAAQKEASSEQNKSNTLAITKSEVATTETISKLAELFKTNTGALSDKIDANTAALAGKIDDIKERVNKLESIVNGGTAHRAENRASISSTTAIVGAVVAVIVLALALLSYQASHKTTVVPTETVTVTTPAKP